MSWRSKGGVARSDTINNINVNTIVADTLTLKDYYYGNFEILGNIRASGSIEIESNLIANYVGAETILANTSLKVLRNATIYGNAAVKVDMYLYDRVIYGNIEKNNNILTLVRNDNVGSFFIDQVKITDVYNGIATEYFDGHVGINNPAPVAALDIFSGLTKVLDVKSNQATNYNILARNVNNTGIVLYTNNETSSVRFFNETEIDGVDPDAMIEYVQGGDLYIDTSNDTIIHSNLIVSKREEEEHIMNETMIVYDPSNSEPFLYNVYENEDVLAGNAMSLVGYDSSSITMLNLITPNKKGLTIAGGAYPYDLEQSTGLLGMMNSAGKYEPVLGITSTDNHRYQKNVFSINTVRPKLEDRNVDINGKVCIRSSELTLFTQADYEILIYSVSKHSPNYSIALGSPYTLLGDEDTKSSDPNDPTLKNYQQKLLYSNDYGKTWNVSDFNNTDIGLVYNTFRGVYAVDDKLVFVGAKYGICYFTNNGGETWNSVSNVPYLLDINSIHIINYPTPTSTSKRVFLVGDNSTYWFNVNSTIYTTTQGINSLDEHHGTIIYSGFIAKKSEGSTNTLYIIGKTSSNPPYYRIQKYAISGVAVSSTPTITYESTNRFEYNSISVYDDDTVVAVGNSIITYTYTAGNGEILNGGWFDLVYDINTGNFPYILNTTFNNIHVYDADRAIIAGFNNAGIIILYTSDGFANWKVLSPNFLMEAGAPPSVLTSTKLSNIFITDLNNVQFTDIITTYDFATYRRGESSIFNIYMPSVFNEENNYLLDVSGGVRIDGNIEINQDLLVKQNAIIQDLFVPGEATINYLIITGNIQATGLTLTGNTTFPEILVSGTITGNDLDIAGNGLIGSLNVLNDIEGSNLVISQTTQTADLSVTNSLNANNINSTNIVVGELFSNYGITTNIIDVKQVATMNYIDASNVNVEALVNTSDIIASNSASVSYLSVSNKSTLNSVYAVDVSINRLYTEADTSLNRLKVYNNSELNTLTVNNLTQANGLIASGDVSLNNLFVTNNSVLNNVYCADISNSNIYTAGKTDTSTLVVTSDTSSNHLFVSSDTSLNRLNVSGLSKMSNIEISGNVILEGNQTSNGITQLNILNATGQTTLSDTSMNNLKIYNNAVIDQTAYINNLFVSSTANLNETNVEGILSSININNTGTINTPYFISTGLSQFNEMVVHTDASLNTMYSGLGEINDLYVNNVANLNYLLVYSYGVINNLTVNEQANLLDAKVSGNLLADNNIRTNTLLVDVSSTSLDLFVNNKATISNLDISGNATIADLNANKAILIDASASQLYVSATADAYDINARNNLTVSNDFTANGTGTIQNAIIVDTLTAPKVIVSSDASINSLFVTNDINSDSIYSKTLISDKTTALDASASKLFISNNTTTKTLLVLEDASLNSNLFVSGNATANDLIAQNTTSTNKLVVLNDASINTLFVSDTSTFAKMVANDISSNTLYSNIGRIVKFYATDACMNSLYIIGDTSFNGNTFTNNTATITELIVSGNATVNKSTTGYATIANLRATSSAIFDISINAPSVYAPLINSTSIQSTDISSNTLNVVSKINVFDLSVNNNIAVKGNIILNGNANATNISASQNIVGSKVFATDISGITLTVVGSSKFGEVDASSVNVNEFYAFGNINGNNSTVSNATITKLNVINDTSLNLTFINGNLNVSGNTFLGNAYITDASMITQKSNKATIQELTAIDASLATARVTDTLTVKDMTLTGTATIQNMIYPNTLLSNKIVSSGDISGNALFVVGNTHINNLDVSGSVLLANTLYGNAVVLTGNLQSGNITTTNASIDTLTATTLSTPTATLTSATVNTLTLGNSTVSGNISGNNAAFTGNLSSARASANFLTLVNGMSSGGDASFNNLYVDGTLTYRSIVSTQTTLQGNTDISNINVIGNSILNTLTTSGDASLNRLFVANQSFLLGNVSLSNDLSSNGNMFLNKKLNVFGDASFNGSLRSYGSTELYGLSRMYSDVSMNKILYVNNVGSNSTDRTIQFINDSSFGNILVNTNAIIRDISLNGNLAVNGNIVSRNKVNISGDTSLNILNVFGTSRFNQILIAQNDASFNRNISVLGNVNLNNTLNVVGDVSLNKTIVNSSATFRNTLNVLGDASFTTLTTTQLAKLNTAEIMNDTSFNGNLKLSDGGYLGQYYYQFKNTTQKIVFPAVNMSSLQLNNYVTITFWARLNSTFKTDGNPIIGLNGSKFIETRQTGVWYISSTAPTQTYGIATGTFQLHCYVVPIGTTSFTPTSKFKIYLDTQLQSNFIPNATYIQNTSSNVFSFGPISQTDLASDLRIRDFQIYNRELEASEITSLYNGTFTDNTNILFRDTALPFNNLKMYSYGNFYVSSDAYVNQNMYIIGDASINGNITTGNTKASSIYSSGDASFNSKMDVYGTTNIYNKTTIWGDASASTLFITGNSTTNGNVIANKGLFSYGDASLNTNVSVGGNTQINQNLNVNGNITCASTTATRGNITTLTSDLIISRDASFNGNLNIGGKTNFSGTFALTGDASLSSLYITNGTQLNGGLRVSAGDASFNGNTLISGDATFRNKVNIFGDISSNGTFTTNGTVTTNGTFIGGGDVSLNGILKVGGNTTINANLSVSNQISANTFTASGLATLNKGLIVSNAGDVSFNSNVFVLGKTVLNGQTTAIGDLSSNNLTIGGITRTQGLMIANNDVSMNANLSLRGIANFANSSKMYVGGDTSLNNLFVNGRTILYQPLIANNDTSLNGILNVNGNTKLNNSLSVFGDLSLNGTLILNGSTQINSASVVLVGDISSNRTFNLGGNAFLRQNLNVYEDTFLNRNVTIGDNNLYYRFNSGTSTITYSSLNFTGRSVGSYITISMWVYIASSWAPNNADVATLISFNNYPLIQWSNVQWAFAATNNAFSIPTNRFVMITLLIPLSNTSTTTSGDYNVYINDKLQNTFSFPSNKYVQNVSTTFSTGGFGNDTNSTRIFIRDFRVFNYALSQTDVGSLFNSTYTTSSLAGLLAHYPLTNGSSTTTAPNVVSGATTTATLTNCSFTYVYSNTTTIVGDSTLRGNTTTSLNASIGRDLTVSQNTTLNTANIGSTLITSGDASFNTNVRVGGNFSVIGSINQTTGDASLNGLYLRGNTTTSRALTAIGDISMNGTQTIIGSSNISQNSSVGGNSTITGDLFVNKNGRFTQKLSAVGDISSNGALYIVKTAEIKERLTVMDDVSFNRNAFILGNLSIRGEKADISGNATIVGNAIIDGNTTIREKLFLTKDASMNGNISILGNVSMGGSQIIQGDISMNGNIRVLKDMYIQNKIFSYNDISSNGDMNVYGNSYVNKMLVVNGDLSLNGVFRQAGTVGYDSINVNQDIFISNQLKVNGKSILNGNVDVSGNVDMKSNLTVKENVNINKSLNITADLSLNGNINAYNSIFINNKLTTAGDSSFNNAIFSGDVSLNKTLFIGNIVTAFGNVDIKGNCNLTKDARIDGNIIVDQNAVLKGNTNIDKYLVVAYDASFSSIYTSSNVNVGNNVNINGMLISNTDISSNQDLKVGRNAEIKNNLSVTNQLTTKDLSVTGSLLLNGQNVFTTTNNWSGKNNFADISANNIAIIGNVSTPLNVNNYLNLAGSTVVESPGNVDAANRNNTYIRLGGNGSNKWSYLRQIETGNNYKIAWDFHNDLLGCNVVYRSVNSATDPDPTQQTRFEIQNGSIGLNGATINHTNGGIFLPNENRTQKIVISSNGATNEFQQYSLGVLPKNMLFEVPANDCSFSFQYGTSATARSPLVIISTSGLDIKMGGLLLDGSNILQRNNEWKGVNSFYGDISANNKIITPTKLGYLSDLSMSLIDHFNIRPAYGQLLSQSNTWTGANTFDTNNTRISKSLIIGGLTVSAQTDGGIYFNSSALNRKIVLATTTNDEFGNYSIGTQTNTTQFMVPTSTQKYTFSYGMTATTKKDFAIIESSGISIFGGSVNIDNSNIFQRNNEWKGVNSFYGDISVNNLTITPTQLSYLKNVSSNIQTQIEGKANIANVVKNTGVETIGGAKTFSDVATFGNTTTTTSNPFVFTGGITMDAPIKFTNKLTNRKIILYSTNTDSYNNEFRNYSLGVNNNNMQFMVDTNNAAYTFSCTSSNTVEATTTYAKSDYAIINNTGIDIKVGSIKLGGNDLFGRQNTWTGKNIFTNDISLNGTVYQVGSVNVNGTIITPTELSYLTGVSRNIQLQFADKANTADVVKLSDNQTITGNKTITGNFIVNNQTISPTELSYLKNVSSNIQEQLGIKANIADVVKKTGEISQSQSIVGSIVVNKSICVAGASSYDATDALYFPNTNAVRKIVLKNRVDNDFQNYSIGSDSNSNMRFMVENTQHKYLFSGGLNTTEKKDYVEMSNDGIDIKAGTLKFNGSDLFGKVNTWSNKNNFTDVSMNGNITLLGQVISDASFNGKIIANQTIDISGGTIDTYANTYFKLRSNGSTGDVCYLRQVGTGANSIQTAWDFVGNANNCRVLFRSINTTSPVTTSTKFEINNGSIGLNGANIRHQTGGIFFPSSNHITRKIVLNEVANNTTQFNGFGTSNPTGAIYNNVYFVPNTESNHSFFAGSGVDISNQLMVIGNTNIQANRPLIVSSPTPTDPVLKVDLFGANLLVYKEVITRTAPALPINMTCLTSTDSSAVIQIGSTTDRTQLIARGTFSALYGSIFRSATSYNGEYIALFRNSDNAPRIGIYDETLTRTRPQIVGESGGGIELKSDYGVHITSITTSTSEQRGKIFIEATRGTTITGGLNVNTGNFSIGGTNIFSRANSWSGVNTFTGNFTVNSITVTPAQISYLSGVSSDIQTQLNGKANTADVVVKTGQTAQTINGIIVFSNSISLGDTTTIDTNGSIYFPNSYTNRKIVLNRSANNEFQNVSIGIQRSAMQFMVGVNTDGYTFSYGVDATSKADYARIDNSGIEIRKGNLIFPTTSSDSSHHRNHKIVLHSVADNTTQFNGFGTTNPSGTIYNNVYYVPNTTSSHRFYVGSGVDTARELMGIGDRNIEAKRPLIVSSSTPTEPVLKVELNDANLLVYKEVITNTAPTPNSIRTCLTNTGSNIIQIGSTSGITGADGPLRTELIVQGIFSALYGSIFRSQTSSAGEYIALFRNSNNAERIGIYDEGAGGRARIQGNSGAGIEITCPYGVYITSTSSSAADLRKIVLNATAGVEVLGANGISAVAFRATSDIRLKTNLIPLETQTNKIKSLVPYSFTWKEDNRNDYGFIAQDVFKKYPIMNSTSHKEDEPIDASGNPIYHSFDYSKLTTILWKGLQETIQQVETQQTQIETQQTQIETQQTQIETQQTQIETQQTQIKSLEETVQYQQKQIEQLQQQMLMLLEKIK